MNISNYPLIGISGSLLTIETGALKGRERAFVGQDYIQAISHAGGIPIILPVIQESQAIAKYVEMIDGLILSGGYDVDPHFYNQEPHALLQCCYPDRDCYEIELVRLAALAEKPILGICRGIQLLNIAFGGSLYQDLSQHSESPLQHNQMSRVDYPIHKVQIKKGTVLHQIVKQATIRTNSLHHQSVHLPAPGFTINAVSSDGIIEGIEKMDESFILGVQWHPELMCIRDPLMRELFRSFVNAAAIKEKGV